VANRGAIWPVVPTTVYSLQLHRRLRLAPGAARVEVDFDAVEARTKATRAAPTRLVPAAILAAARARVEDLVGLCAAPELRGALGRQ
jgi:hypothetical protein